MLSSGILNYRWWMYGVGYSLLQLVAALASNLLLAQSSIQKIPSI
jgi:hypothetical protein